MMRHKDVPPATRPYAEPEPRPGSDPGHASAGEAGASSRAGAVPSSQRGETSMINVRSVDELAQRLAALVPPGLQQAREDLTQTFRGALQAGLRDLDLVTREEFDVQRCVLLRTREKIEELEQQVANLERAIGGVQKPTN